MFISFQGLVEPYNFQNKNYTSLQSNKFASKVYNGATPTESTWNLLREGVA